MGPFLNGWNFQPLFALGLFAEELLFLVGCWMLARRHFASPYAAFFVSVAASGSSFGLDHYWLNVHSVYALPLLLVLLHGFLESGSRRQLLLAAHLVAIQALGSPAGMGLSAPLAAVLYFAGRAFVLGEAPGRRLKEIGWKRSDLGVAAGIAAVWLPVLFAGAWSLSSGGERPSFADLLAYAGLANPLRYVDFLVGATPSLDWSLYCGALTLGFAIVALRSAPRPIVLRVTLALPAGLLLLGAFFFAFYLAFPSLRPTTAPAFGTPLVRLLLAFLAGAGLQRIIEERKPERLTAAGRCLLVGALLVGLLSWSAAMKPDLFRELLSLLVAGEPSASTESAAFLPRPFPDRGGSSAPADLAGASAVAAGLAGLSLLLWGSRSRLGPFALTLVLVLHPIDVFSWRFRMSWMETFSANPTQRHLQRLEPVPHPAPKVASLTDAPRFRAFHQKVPGRFNPPYAARKEAELVPGYWGVELAGGATEDGLRPRSPLRSAACLLVGLGALFWLLWTARSALRLAARGEATP